MNHQPSAGKAIIIGAGIAGLLAARVLSEQLSEVLIIERDDLPQTPENRPGTPQAYHPHRLLPSGKMILEKLFPGYTEELLTHGAFLREKKHLYLINQYGNIEFPDERDAGCSRALLEWVIRRRVQQLANVRFLSGQEVLGLLATPDQSAVTGVYLRQRGQSGQPQSVMADWVVDTSGRSSKLVQWLAALGYATPEPERLAVSLGYSTRHYKIPADLIDPPSVILIDANPAQRIAGGAFGAIENNIAEMVLFRAGGEAYPTTDGDHYAEEAAQLLSPRIAEELQKLEPLGEPRGFRVPESIRRHFEEMPRWPLGLLVMGDAICTFDPVHGQGITIAALEAEILAAGLAEQRLAPRPHFERRIIQEMQKSLEPAWWLTLVADLAWPGVRYSGPLSLKGITFAQNFFDLYLKEVYGRGNMEYFEKYFMMTALLTSPRDVINRETVNALLAHDDSAEAAQLRQEFFQEGARQLDELLEQHIPHFTLRSLPMPVMQP